MEQEFDRKNPLTLEQKHGIREGLYQLAKEFGRFDPADNTLDEDDILLAKAQNANRSKPLKQKSTSV